VRDEPALKDALSPSNRSAVPAAVKWGTLNRHNSAATPDATEARAEYLEVIAMRE
jgi:hypothetical protein